VCPSARTNGEVSLTITRWPPRVITYASGDLDLHHRRDITGSSCGVGAPVCDGSGGQRTWACERKDEPSTARGQLHDAAAPSSLQRPGRVSAATAGGHVPGPAGFFVACRSRSELTTTILEHGEPAEPGTAHLEAPDRLSNRSFNRTRAFPQGCRWVGKVPSREWFGLNRRPGSAFPAPNADRKRDVR
jgi:hypothetical protein